MSGEFISPNWHAILIHYPLALLTLGVMLEVLTLLWRNGKVRTAGRWMIGIGAFAAFLAAIAGIYALRDAARPALAKVHPAPWHQVTELGPLTAEQWEYLDRHVWLGGPATGLILLIVLVWIAASRNVRRKLYVPGLLLLLAGVGILVSGAWYGAEAVYRYGTAVHRPTASADEPGQPAGHEHAHPNGHGDDAQNGVGVAYFLPPLQLHVVLAGLALAVGLLAIAMQFKHRPKGDSTADATADRPWKVPRALWGLVAVLALGAAVAGLWATVGGFTAAGLQTNLSTLVSGEHLRLLLHVLLGLAIIVLPLVLAFLKATRELTRRIAAICIVLLVVVAATQVALGVLVLFDGHSGPLLAFNSPPPEQEEPSRETPAVAANGDGHDTAAHSKDDPAPTNRRSASSSTADQPSSGSEDPPSSDESDPAPAAVVGMTNTLKFEPDQLTVRAGATVRWKNDSDLVHTVTADASLAKEPDNVRLPEGAEPFHSGKRKPGDAFERTFEVPGRYRYVCLPHEAAGMIAELVVEP